MTDAVRAISRSVGARNSDCASERAPAIAPRNAPHPLLLSRETARAGVPRRKCLRSAAIAAAAIGSGARIEVAKGAEAKSRASAAGGLVDVNIWLSRWPFRRLPLDDTRALVRKLKSEGVSEAWAGTF